MIVGEISHFLSYQIYYQKFSAYLSHELSHFVPFVSVLSKFLHQSQDGVMVIWYEILARLRCRDPPIRLPLKNSGAVPKWMWTS